MESAELLLLEHSTSVVCKFFGFPSQDGKIIETDKKKRRRVYCKLCRHSYSYVGNTSNMWQHLEESHVEEFRKVKKDAPQSSAAESPCNRENSDSDIRMQPTLPQVFQVKNPYQRTSTRWKTLTDSVCYFIAKDMQLYQTVNNPGFQHLLHSFDQRYHPPDRKTLSTNYIPRLYDREKGRVSSALASVDSFALTTDIWTSRHNQAYTGLTVHYVDDCYQL